MPVFQPGHWAFGAFMVAAKTLETLQNKGVLTQEEGAQIIHNAVNDMENSGNPDALEGAKVIRHFFSSPLSS